MTPIHGRLCRFLTALLPRRWAGGIMRWLGVTCSLGDEGQPAVTLRRGGEPDDPLTPVDAFLYPEWTREQAGLRVAGHPLADVCPEFECLICGYRDCPYSEPMHYHHDGCPRCWAEEIARKSQGGRG